MNHKIRLFLLSLAATIFLFILFNFKWGNLPPLGKFLDPFQGCWQNAEKVRNKKDATFNLPGLKEEVRVYFDERMVPHVFAKNDEDLYYVQGYLTAKFRLWQMEIQTQAAAGRLSEVIGKQGLSNDRLVRRLGLEYGAEAAEKYIAQDPESQKMVDAYCKGVNSYIQSLKPADYPLEYKLLDYKPEEWKPVKVALLLKNMAMLLSTFDFDIENTNFLAKYGEKDFEELYPDFIKDEDPVIPAGTKWNFEAPVTGSVPGKEMTDELSPGTCHPEHSLRTMGGVALCDSWFDSAHHDISHETYANALEKSDDILGSNNWAVSGSKTATGKPILCNDPHLHLTLPSIWYEMHLVSPDMNVYGVSIPGALGIIIGFNDSISWGMTNGGRDVRDWFKLKFKDASRDEYEYNGQWLKTEKKVEVYKVRGGNDVLDTVIYTRFGPVMFDESYGNADSKKDLAMSWTALLPSNEFKTFYNLNRAKNYDDYMEALNYYTCPSQNFAFASRSGDIAIKQQGRFPVRDKATEQGKFVCDGTTGNDEWKSFVPNEDNPAIKNPERGFVSSANQHPTDSTYPYYYSGVGVYENYRNRRINDLLAPANNMDVDFMKKMQSDVYNLHASEALPVMLSLLDQSGLDDKERKMVETLQHWNYYDDANEVAPVYFEIWWNELRKLLWDEMADKTVPMKQPNFYVTVQFLRDDSTSHFYDNLSTPQKETRRDIVLQAFKRIQDTLKAKQFTAVAEPYANDNEYIKKDLNPHDWGSYKDSRISYLLPGVDAFSDLHLHTGGNLGVIDANNTQYGPSWRMIVDEGNMKAYVSYPGGESGNPGSPYYDNMVQDWVKGKYYEANFTNKTEDLNNKSVMTLTFEPAK